MKFNNAILKKFNPSFLNKFFNRNSISNFQYMTFGGSHSHDHGHGHGHHEKKDRIQEYLSEPYHKNYYEFNHLNSHHDNDHGHHSDECQFTRFDPVKYFEKLNSKQRKEKDEKVQFVDDDLTPQTADYVSRGYNEMYQPSISEYDFTLLPHENKVEKSNASLLDETEIIARIYNNLRQFDFMDLDKIKFNADYEKELGLDSLDWNALLTSIEYEFNTLFNDNFYEHWRCLEDVVKALKGDEYVF